MANDIKYVGNTFMMANDKKPRPIYNKHNKFTIAFKKLYREGKIADAPHLNFVYKPTTDRFVNKPQQTDMLDKRFKKTKVIKKTFQKEFEIINNKITKKTPGTSYQPSDINDINSMYKFQIKNNAGKTIKVVTKVNDKQIHSTQLEVPKTGFSNWWKHNSTDFMQNSSVSRVYGELADIFPKTEDSVLLKMNDIVSINIVQSVKLEAKKVNQKFAEGINNCMLTPIKDWAIKCADDAKGDSSKRKYKAMVVKLDEFNEQYQTGIPEGDVQNICNQLTVDINVDLPLHPDHFVTCKSLKKRIKVFNFINTRLNHVNLNEVVNKDVTKVSEDELQQMAVGLNEDDQYFDYNKDKDGRYTKIRTLKGSFQMDSQYNEVCNEFEKTSGLENCQLDFIGADHAVSRFIDLGAHYNGTIDYQNVCGQWNKTNTSQIDMHRAYAMFHNNPLYDGFVGKVTDFRNCKDIDIEFARKNKGYYRVWNFDFSRVSKAKMVHFNAMKCYEDLNVYPSVELCWLYDLGVEFDFIEGCWGTKIDFRFSQEMIDGKDNKIRYYAKWSGQQTSFNCTQRFYMKGSKNYFENMSAMVEDCAIKCYEDGEGVLEYKKKHCFHLAHITGFITMYQRLAVFEQLFKMD